MNSSLPISGFMNGPSFPLESLLARSSPVDHSAFTPLQSQVDGLVGGFVEQATDLKSLAAMTAGGMAYRLGRVGVMATGAGRLASLGIGLGAEVTAFEMTNRSLASLTGDTRSNPNLWRWDGNGGIRQGLLSSLITFGSLKGAGHLAQGENLVVQHLLQDTGMVLGHQVSGALGITPRPTGSLLEQFLHAEVTNLQISAGMALAHNVAPGIQGIERGLDLSLRGIDGGARFELQPALAMAGRRGILGATHDPRDHISLMAAYGENGNGRNKSGPPTTEGISPARPTSSLSQPIYRSRFQQCWEDLAPQNQSAARKALQSLFDYYRDGTPLPKGLGFKKLGGGRDDFFEIRVSHKDRILFRKNNNQIEFLFIGGHNELKQIVRRSDLGEDLNGGANPHFDPLKPRGSDTASSHPATAESGPGVKKERYFFESPTPRGEEIHETADEDPESGSPPVSPLEDLLSTPFPSHLNETYPEVGVLEPEALRRAAEEDIAMHFLHSEGRAVFQLLAFLRQIKPRLDVETQRQLDTLEEETLTLPGDIHTVTHLTFQRYEALRQNLISQISLELVGLFPEIRGEGPPLAGWEAGEGLQNLLSRKRLPESVRETLGRLMDEAFLGPDPMRHYLERAAAVFLENRESILNSYSLIPSERHLLKTTCERDFPELNAVEAEEPVVSEGLSSLADPAIAGVREFWSRNESELLSKAYGFYSRFLKNRPEGAPLERLFKNLSLLAAAGSSPPELAVQGTTDLLSLYQENQKVFFSALVESPEGLKILESLPEISRAAQDASPWLNEREEFLQQRAEPFALYTQISAIILSHPRLRQQWEESLWKAIVQETVEANPPSPPEVRQKVAHLTRHLSEFYVQHRDELRRAKLRTQDLPSSTAQALERLDRQLPWRFGEILFHSEEIIQAKRSRFTNYLSQPDSGEAIFKFSQPSGINGELVLSSVDATDLKLGLEREGRLVLHHPMSGENIDLTRETQVEIIPLTPFYRLRPALELQLPPHVFRLVRLAMELETPLKIAIQRELDRAIYLLLSGSPSSWVLHQISTRVIQTYEAHREAYLAHLQQNRPDILLEIIQKLPDVKLIDPLSFLTLITDPIHRLWPLSLQEAVRSLQGELGSTTGIIWQSADNFAASLGIRLLKFYLLYRHETLRAMGITEDLREILKEGRETFSPERMPELYQIDRPSFMTMGGLFRSRLRVYNPNSFLHEAHLRAYILINWRTVPARLKDEFNKFLGTDREEMPYRTMLLALKFYVENRDRILPYLPFLN